MKIPPYSKEISGFDGFYRIDESGQIWSCRKRCPGLNRRSDVWRKMKTNGRNDDGHPIIHLTLNGKMKEYRVHRLLLETFVGPPPKGMMCRHLDSNPENNVLKNLKWGTNRENQLDRRGTATDERGEKNPAAKLKWWMIREMRQIYTSWERDLYRQLAKRYGVDPMTIEQVISGETWKEVV